MRGWGARALTTAGLVITVIASSMTAAQGSEEAPTGPAWPPPGGVSWTPSGDIARAGGATWSYTDIAHESFDDLWWGPWDGESIKLAMDGAVDEEGETLSLDAGASDLDNGVAVWTGSTSVTHFVNNVLVTETLPTRFVLSAGSLVDAATVGITSGSGAVHRIEADYSVNLIFQAFRGSWQPARDLYDSLNTNADGGVITSFGAGYYYNLANAIPVADDQELITDEDVPLQITLTATDADGDDLTFEVVDGPSNGSLSGDAPFLLYTPGADFNGADSFTFTASDGQDTSAPATVSITIDPVNDAPRLADDEAAVEQYGSVVIDVLANDYDVEGDPLWITEVSTPGSGSASVGADQTITYTPSPAFKGSDSFTYTVEDGNGGVSTATVTVLEISCGETGPVSGPVDTVVEPAVGTLSADRAKDVHDVNCGTIAPLGL